MDERASSATEETERRSRRGTERVLMYKEMAEGMLVRFEHRLPASSHAHTHEIWITVRATIVAKGYARAPVCAVGDIPTP